MTKTYAMSLTIPNGISFTPGKWYEVIDTWGGDGDPVVKNDTGGERELLWRGCYYANGGDWLRFNGNEAPPDGWVPGDPLEDVTFIHTDSPTYR